MPVLTVELNAKQDTVRQPVIWRIGKLFNVVTNIRRARVTEEYAQVSLKLEGTTAEVTKATDYLRALGAAPGGEVSQEPLPTPEESVPQTNTIEVRLTTIQPAQTQPPFLYRVGKDFEVVVNIAAAAFDDEEGGWFDVSLSGDLIAVQRAIAYLHTTGILVNPRQRSVTDFGNL